MAINKYMAEQGAEQYGNKKGFTQSEAYGAIVGKPYKAKEEEEGDERILEDARKLIGEIYNLGSSEDVSNYFTGGMYGGEKNIRRKIR